MSHQETSSDPRTVEMYCPACDASYSGEALHCPNDGAKLVRLVEKPDPMIGRKLDERFTIKAKLGAGGMGAVYRALQHSVGREVAIKVIEPRLAGHREVTKRFLREAQLSSRLSQPNTVSVLDFGQTVDGLLYLVMELLEGKSLEDILQEEGALSEDRVIRIGVQICDALDAASVLHIVHRDLKPGNVVILNDPPGRDMVKVLDFGIAKSLAGDSGITTVTRSDMILGTPSYIAPEAVHGANVDGRADLYSLGVMLYQLISGRLPFAATTVNAMLASHSADVPRPLPDGVNPKLRAIIEKLLAKDPDVRFSTAAETRAALSAASRHLSSSPEEAIAVTLPAGSGPRQVLKASDVLSATPAAANPTMEPVPGEATGLSRRAWPAAIALGVAALGVVAFIALRSPAERPAAQSAPAMSPPGPPSASPTTASAPGPASDAPPSAAATAAPAPSPADERSLVHFALDSKPPGVRVVLRRPGAYDEELCPMTPCADVTRPKLDTDAELWFHHAGYRPTHIAIDLRRDRIEHAPELVPIKRAEPPKTKPPKTKPPKTKPPTSEPVNPNPLPGEEFLPAKQRRPGESF